MTPALAAIALAVIVTLGYAGLCVVEPFGRCLPCAGRPGRACPGCDGTGRRTRLGRRLYHWAIAEYRSGGRDRSYDDFRD